MPEIEFTEADLQLLRALAANAVRTRRVFETVLGLCLERGVFTAAELQKRSGIPASPAR